MKKINKFIDKLEKRIENIFKGISHGQVINQKKVKEAIKKEVIALCKEYYEKGYRDSAFECDDEYANCDEYHIYKKRNINETFDEED
jgi:cystathionine beta-lyase family protein involved in aluminum resistance